jgi:putative two-component system response regulator
MQAPDVPGPARILIVDDQPLTRELMTLVVHAQGHKTLIARSGEEALSIAAENDLDLVILDVVMPGMDGFEVARRLKSAGRNRNVPIVIVSTLDDKESRINGLAAGADDFLTRPVDRLELKVRVQNLLRMKRFQDELSGQNAVLERKVELRTTELERSNRETIHTLIRAAAHRDDESGAHVKRMGLYATLLAQRLELDPQFCAIIGFASQLHDIGKIGIPDRILEKPAALNEDEWDVMKTHTDIGGQMLALNSSPYLAMAADIARAHHERWDGTGYPRGLRGEAIPLAARITQVCDTYDTLRCSRPYKPALDHATAGASILAGDSKSRPSHFDPLALAAFKVGLADFRDIFETIRD